MTKERLEELIKQGATIWSNTIWYHGKINLINSDTDEYRIIEDNFDNVYLSHHAKGTDDCYDGQWDLEELREDVDRAEWEYKIYAERTERFEPPMWDDIEDYFFVFITREKNGYIVWKFETIKGKYSNSGISVWNDEYELYVADATKENYEKACEIVRDLFKEKK